MVVEAIGGFLSGSLALLADAAHMLTDAFALGLAASAQWLSRRPANDSLHFGYRRSQVLAAFVNGLLLALLLAWISYEAVFRLFNPVEVAWRPMLAIAIVGLAANAVAYFVLHGANTNNINIRGAMLHVVSDFLGSVAAVIAAFVIMLTGWMRIDPILSLVVAALIARSALQLLRETSHILLEGAPRDIDVGSLVAELREAAPDVVDIHDVYIWQITPESARITLHACVSDAGAAASSLTRIKSFLEEKYGIAHSTVQIEFDSICPDEDEGAVTQLRKVAGQARRPHHHHGHTHQHGPQKGADAAPPAVGAAFVGHK